MIYHYIINKGKVSKVVGKDGWLDFIELCVKIKSPGDFKQFFDLFLTIEEKEVLASRYLIIKALLEGDLPQREIAAKYRVSIAQITRGSNALKIIDPKLKASLIKLLKGK
ncbi:MAG TPA: trp operon repressor [Parachlamydiaceae bacterium]|nr:trp operon repressor [Parachlamydiaceae bacterium]